MDVGPEQVLVTGQENVALGLEIINPESYATPMKTNPPLEHEMWGITLPNMNFQIEDFGPKMCSTPSQEINKVSAMRGARTPPTLPLLPTQGQNQELFSIPNPGLALPTKSSTTTLAVPIYKHTVEFSYISRKPKPMHFVKKHGNIPDGLVQARLTQIRLLTNQGRGIEMESKMGSDSTNGKISKWKAGLMDSSNAIRQRKS